jgi:hypothetical protein
MSVAINRTEDVCEGRSRGEEKNEEKNMCGSNQLQCQESPDPSLQD